MLVGLLDAVVPIVMHAMIQYQYPISPLVQSLKIVTIYVNLYLIPIEIKLFDCLNIY